jgi:hypothetical protein
MKKIVALLSFALLAGCCSDALADEFGSRFGTSSPYALQNTLGKATDNLNGIGLEDLNTITPSSGSPDEDTAKDTDAKDETPPAPAPANTPETKPADPQQQ